MYVVLFIFLLATAHAYHTTEDLLARVENECKRVDDLSCTWEGDMLVVDWKKYRPRDVLWTFNEHARERITGELALAYILRLKDIRPLRRITIIPVVNVWGRKQVEHSEPCRRKNKNEVDTNRNYPVKRHHFPLHSQQYEGRTALSEPETQFIASLLQNHTRMFINIHSGEFSIYTAWDSSFNLPPNNEKVQTNVEKWGVKCPQCVVGPAATTSSYLAFGTAVDYATTLGVDAYTFEIYGSEHGTCERIFNPRNPQPILDMWTDILTLSLD